MSGTERTVRGSAYSAEGGCPRSPESPHHYPGPPARGHASRIVSLSARARLYPATWRLAVSLPLRRSQLSIVAQMQSGFQTRTTVVRKARAATIVSKSSPQRQQPVRCLQRTFLLPSSSNSKQLRSKGRGCQAGRLTPAPTTVSHHRGPIAEALAFTTWSSVATAASDIVKPSNGSKDGLHSNQI